jgi:hypothetical protein
MATNVAMSSALQGADRLSVKMVASAEAFYPYQQSSGTNSNYCQI